MDKPKAVAILQAVSDESVVSQLGQLMADEGDLAGRGSVAQRMKTKDAVGKALRKLNALGIMSLDSTGQASVHMELVAEAVRVLAAPTPLLQLAYDNSSLTGLIQDGKLIDLPEKHNRLLQVIQAIADTLPETSELSEAELILLVDNLIDLPLDHATVRRYLVDFEHYTRSADGRSYVRAGRTQTV